jgi:hypothetical protein
MSAKSSPIRGTTGDEEEDNRRWFFKAGQYWTEWVRRCNWYNFSFVKLDVEWDKMTGRWVLDVALLGFYAQVTYLYDRSFNDAMMSVKDQITAGLQAEHPGCRVEDPLGVLDELQRREDANK